MAQPVLSAEELMAWLETTSTRWRDLIQAHPEILGFPCDVMNVENAAGLLQHIVGVELRFAERLAGLPTSDYSTIPSGSAEKLYATHERALGLVREQLAAPNVDWEQVVEFQTRSMGPGCATRRTILFHLLFHSIRHYAQLATLVRQHGISPGWPMDYLFMELRSPAPHPSR